MCILLGYLPISNAGGRVGNYLIAGRKDAKCIKF
jgi:hypothetical protein